MTIEHSPFAPPTLGAAPRDAPPGLPTLPPSTPAPTPAPSPTLAPETSSPQLSAPQLSAPQLSAPQMSAPQLSAPQMSAPPGPSTPNTPATPTPKRSRTPVIVLGVLGVATIAGAAWFSLATAEDSTDSTASSSSVEEPAPPDGLDIAPQDVSSPIVVPIDDARDVTAEINENSEESDALDMLGLDETGNEAVATEPAAGHRFTWSYGTDSTAVITVDATTGNYEFESSDGVEWAQVDGTSYGRRGAIEWAEVDADLLESVPRLGLDDPITIDRVLDPLTAGYTALVTDQRDDGTALITAEVDAFAYAEGHPTERISWMTLLGHPANGAEIQPGEIVVVQAELGADGSIVELMTVTTSTFATSYLLDDVFDTAPVIEIPAIEAPVVEAES